MTKAKRKYTIRRDTRYFDNIPGKRAYAILRRDAFGVLNIYGWASRKDDALAECEFCSLAEVRGLVADYNKYPMCGYREAGKSYRVTS